MKHGTQLSKVTRLSVLLVFLLCPLSACSGRGVEIQNPTLFPPADNSPQGPILRGPNIEPIDPANPLPLFFIHNAPIWMQTDEFNNNPLIPPIPVELSCTLAGFQADKFQGKIQAYLDGSEIDSSFDPATMEVRVKFGPLFIGPHYLVVRTIGHPGFFASNSYSFEVVDSPPDFSIGWEDGHLILEFTKPIPHWELESENSFSMEGFDASAIDVKSLVSNQIFRVDFNSPLPHPKDIDAYQLSQDIKVIYNGFLGFKEGVWIEAKGNKGGDIAPREGEALGECLPNQPWTIDNIEWKHFDSEGGEDRRVVNYDHDMTVCDTQIDVPWDACQKGITYRTNYVGAGTLNPCLSFDNDEDTVWTQGQAQYYWEWHSNDLGFAEHAWPRNTYFIPRYSLMLNCGQCNGNWNWIEKGPVWFGNMHVDGTPPVLADEAANGGLNFVIGSELNQYVQQTLIPGLIGIGQTYTHEGQTGSSSFLYNYYMQAIGNYVDPNIVYGILVAKDGDQQTDHDPGGLLSRQLAIDTVTCGGLVSCGDYIVEDIFFIDKAPYAAAEFATGQGSEYIWPWPQYCQPLKADGFAAGEFSCWILGIPLEYYTTYKKIKVRMKDDINNWRRVKVYDYLDQNTKLWIDPPEDEEEFCPGQDVLFTANISPESLTPLLDYVNWQPVYEDGTPRLPYDEETNPTGYKSEILIPGPGKNFGITFLDDDFYVKAYYSICGKNFEDIKHIKNPCAAFDRCGQGETFERKADIFDPDNPICRFELCNETPQRILGNFDDNKKFSVPALCFYDESNFCEDCDEGNPCYEDFWPACNCEYNHFEFHASLDYCASCEGIIDITLVAYPEDQYPHGVPHYSETIDNPPNEVDFIWRFEILPPPGRVDYGKFTVTCVVNMIRNGQLEIYRPEEPINVEIFLFRPPEVLEAATLYTDPNNDPNDPIHQRDGYFWGIQRAPRDECKGHAIGTYYCGSIDCSGLIVQSLRRLCIYHVFFNRCLPRDWHSSFIVGEFCDFVGRGSDPDFDVSILETGDIFYDPGHIGLYYGVNGNDKDKFISFEARGGETVPPCEHIRNHVVKFYFDRSIASWGFYKWNYNKILSWLRCEHVLYPPNPDCNQ